MSHETPPSANLLDGAALARRIRERVRDDVDAMMREGAPAPRLRVFLVGDDPASEAYVRGKTRSATEAGLRAETIRIPAAERPERLLEGIAAAREDPDLDGILVQLPLPAGHDRNRVLDALDPWRDVDGLHPENVGLLHQGRPRFVPCTPAGILVLIDAYRIPLSGRPAVVLGRSEIVGKPAAALLTARNATVTLAHSRTEDLPAVCRGADLLVVAIGRAGFLTEKFVREGAVIVDVGVNRISSLEELPPNLASSSRIRAEIEAKGRALVGDVDFDSVARRARWITPVPGGVGPLTVAMLLENTARAARLRRGMPVRAAEDPG
jgi:methylenetetrahydrofolate dehydrogenase (NADP+) / methenyltetrahydrofolate cyclohydrolase